MQNVFKCFEAYDKIIIVTSRKEARAIAPLCEQIRKRDRRYGNGVDFSSRNEYVEMFFEGGHITRTSFLKDEDLAYVLFVPNATGVRITKNGQTKKYVLL